VPVYAIKALEEYRQKVEKLAAEDPNDIDRQRELAVIAFTIGTFLEFKGGEGDPLSEFQKYSAITAQLASHKPTDVGLARDLAASHIVLGEVLQNRSHRDPERENQDLIAALIEFQGAQQFLSNLAQRIRKIQIGATKWR
jgi:hypothetical protein